MKHSYTQFSELHHFPDRSASPAFAGGPRSPGVGNARMIELPGGAYLPTAARQRTRAVNLLEQAGVVGTTGKGPRRWLHRDMSVETAVQRGVDAEEEHQELIRSRIEMVRGYAETTGCRRQFLLGHFGEQLDTPCGTANGVPVWSCGRSRTGSPSCSRRWATRRWRDQFVDDDGPVARSRNGKPAPPPGQLNRRNREPFGQFTFVVRAASGRARDTVGAWEWLVQ